MFGGLGTEPNPEKKNDNNPFDAMGNSASGNYRKDAGDVAEIRKYVWRMAWFTFFNLAFTVFAASMTLSVLWAGQGKLKVYMDAAELTPEKVGEMSTNAQNIVSNVRSISDNMVPVSEVTAKAVVNGTGAPSNVSFAEAATAALIGVGHADWNSVLGNGSLAMGSVANLNFSVVTSLFEQAREPETQSVIRRQIDKALSTFDYATRGVANVVTVFRDGVVAEEEAAAATTTRKKTIS